MLLAAGLLSVPMLLWLYFLAALMGTSVAVVALRQTDGLDASTFGGGFWLAAVAGLVGVIAGLVFSYAWRHDDRRRVLRTLVQPTVGLLLVFVVPASLLTLLEIGSVDVPDVVSTTAILGSVGYLWFVMPFALGKAAWKLLRTVHRWSLTQAQRASFTAIATPLVMWLAATVLFGPVALRVDVLDDHASGVIHHVGQIEHHESDGPAELARAVLAGAKSNDDTQASSSAAKSAASLAAVSSANQRRFEACFEILMAPEGDRKSPFEAAIVRLSRTLSADDAYDLAAQKLLDVCEKHAQNSYLNLAQVYAKAIRYARRDFVRKRNKQRELLSDIYGFHDPRSRGPDHEVRELLRKCLAKLGSGPRRTLQLWLTSRDYDELARKMGDVSYDAARGRVSRAKTRARQTCKSAYEIFK